VEDRDRERKPKPRLRFVSFEPRGKEYIAFIALEDVLERAMEGAGKSAAEGTVSGTVGRTAAGAAETSRDSRPFANPQTVEKSQILGKSQTSETASDGLPLLLPSCDSEQDLDGFLARAARVYKTYVGEIRRLLAQMDQMKRDLVPVPARLAWLLGDAVFRLKDSLEDMLLEVDDLYSHLERDTDVTRAFLKDAVTFRRYLPDLAALPLDLTWHRCKDAPRRAALEIKRGKVPGTSRRRR